jgi:hypothetical protein
VNGRVLHFYLAGINNQNFLMRDKETGTWWQQINGKAVYGPLRGASLDLVPYDELTFGEWKSEVSDGKVFAPVAKYTKEYDSNWEPEIAKLPVVISFPGTELKSRDVVVGLEVDGASRAYPWDTLVKQSPVVDHVHGTPLLVAVGPDGKSFRAFVSRIDGKDAEFFLKGDPETEDKTLPEEKRNDTTEAKPKESSVSNPPTNSGQTPPAQGTASAPSTGSGQAPPAQSSAGDPPAVAGAASPHPQESAQKPAPPPKPWILLDTATASEWNFQGCAISGPAQGKCLERVPILKDYWFDWRNYHHDTTIYKR